MDDLHLEFSQYQFEIPKVDADCLILAGDICVGSKAKDWILNLTDRYQHIFYVPGNHEYYKQNYNKLRKSWNLIEDNWNQESKKAQIHIMDPKCVFLSGYTIIGGTLWTSFNEGDPTIIHIAAMCMNDYRMIADYEEDCPPERLSPNTIYEQYKQDLGFIEYNLQHASYKDNKVIVITHHTPSKLSTHPKYAHDVEFNHLYSSNLDHLVKNVDLWCHGHTHDSFDYYIGKGRVICNPRGYYNHEENPRFNPSLVIEI